MKLYQSNRVPILNYFVSEAGTLMCYLAICEQFYIAAAEKLKDVRNGTKLRNDIEVEGKLGNYRIVPTDLENV